jgi:hypothetical protein
MPPTTPGGAWTRALLYRCSSRCPGLIPCSLELCRLGLTFLWPRRPPIPHMLRGCATLSRGRHRAGNITRATSRGCHYGVGIQGGHHAAGIKRLLRAGCQGGSLAIVARCSRSAFLVVTGTAPLLERFLRPEAVWPLRLRRMTLLQRMASRRTAAAAGCLPPFANASTAARMWPMPILSPWRETGGPRVQRLAARMWSMPILSGCRMW